MIRCNQIDRDKDKEEEANKKKIKRGMKCSSTILSSSDRTWIVSKAIRALLDDTKIICYWEILSCSIMYCHYILVFFFSLLYFVLWLVGRFWYFGFGTISMFIHQHKRCIRANDTYNFYFSMSLSLPLSLSLFLRVCSVQYAVLTAICLMRSTFNPTSLCRSLSLLTSLVL